MMVKLVRTLSLGGREMRCVRTAIGWSFNAFDPRMLTFRTEEQAQAFLEREEGREAKKCEIVPLSKEDRQAAFPRRGKRAK